MRSEWGGSQSGVVGWVWVIEDGGGGGVRGFMLVASGVCECHHAQRGYYRIKATDAAYRTDACFAQIV